MNRMLLQVPGRRLATGSILMMATAVIALAAVPSTATPPPAIPFPGQESGQAMTPSPPGEPAFVGPYAGLPFAALEALADRVTDLQADITEDNAGNGNPDADPEDGGWDWRLPPGTPAHTAAASPSNLYGPIAKGLAYGYMHTGLARYRTAVEDAMNGRAATYPTRRGQNALFEALVLMSEETGDPAYATAAKTLWDNFLLLGSGSWPGGTAEAWAAYIHTVRAGQGIPELAPWDVNLYIQSALALDRYFPGQGYDTDATDIAQEIKDQVDLGTWNPGNPAATYYVYGIMGALHAYVTTDVAPGDVPGYKTTVLGFDYDLDLGPQGTAYALMALANFPGDVPVATYVQGGLGYLAGVVEANGDVVSFGDIYPEEMAEVMSGIFESGDFVAPAPPGLCISNPTPCVTVPVVFNRADTSPARGASVTIALSSNLELCGAITQGSWLGAYNSTFQVYGGGGIYTVDQAILGQPCGVTTGGTLFLVPVKKTLAAGDGTGTITVTAVDVRDCGNPPSTLVGVPGAPASLTIDTTPPAAVADLAATQRLTGNDSDGTTKIDLTFTLPLTADSVLVWRKGFGFYPEYDDLGGAAPTLPAGYPPAGWTRVFGGTSAPGFDEPATRDFWYYVVYTKDACGNVSAVSNMTGGTLNYHLGDVTDGAPVPAIGDNAVGTADVSLLGAHYGETAANPAWLNYLDVGPTSTNSTHGRPLTDDVVNFEDLLMFAINYGVVTLTAPPEPVDPASGRPRLALFTEPTADGILARLILEDNPALVKGIHALVAFDRTALTLARVEQGQLLDAQVEPVFFRHLDEGAAGIHAALLGRGLAIRGSGEVARLYFTGHGSLELSLADMRGVENQPIGQASAGIDAPAAALAIDFALKPARPNPFNPSTMIGFQLPTAGRADLSIYDVGGRLVRTLVAGELGSGEHMAFWDGRDGRGIEAGSGVYLVRLEASGRVATQKLQLMK